MQPLSDTVGGLRCGFVGLKFPGCGLNDFPFIRAGPLLVHVSEPDLALFEIHKINAFILLPSCLSLVLPKLGDPYAIQSRLL